ncbi:uncharacterized protein ACHE_40999S [Aspergillus chevalieri]|uniref:5-Methylcytosine G/T mismatch-specific DNA glycosylase n=1 Tax=Aspergillus chevalieri TaxID=182096 RepID=A0A7R7VPJ5_ASPCH|nr:uncharacterized protein ACHE_40999S [Aspergillus chevalieri]BCR88435.1 hypothetical protein ACHE_40999S [Aspergillus chevalieri]
MSSPLHIMLPLRLNERDRDRNRHRNHRTSSSSSSQSTHRHHKHRSSYGSTRSSTKDPEREYSTAQPSTPSTSPTSPTSSRRFSMPAVDDPAASFLESRTSLPYPNFSKAHSKEFVGNPDPPTPDPTDLTETQQKEDRHHTENGNGNNNHHAPPSPPLTGLDQHSRKGSSVGDKQEKKEESTERPKAKIRIRTGSNRSSSSLRSKEEEGKSTRTMRPETPKSKMSGSHERDTPSRTASHKPSRSKVTEETTLPKRASTHRDVRSPPRSPAAAGSANGSDATIGPQYRSSGSRRVKTPEKPPSRTQNRSSTSSPYQHRHHNNSGYRTPADAAYDHGRPSTTNSSFGAPPPPPPPPEVPASIPRVDYLLQNGGLDRHTHKTLLLGSHYPDIAPPPSYQPHIAAHRIFEPFSSLLDEYQNVMTKNGSLAVATGYRSVARRLLDRLEAVFARDISCESCSCLMCENEDMTEPHPGVSWGEVLELVSGRKELPTWPPFMMAPSVVDTGASGEEHIPMQKMDIDIPEEYREHYVRQSRKTKLAVDKWLSEQAGQATSAPDAVDDDTLTFAMLTHLGSEQRPLFCSLLGISAISPAPSAVGGPSRSRPHALISSASAIQRLYRLSSLPRDPETAIYMLNNPGIHHVLATLSAISDDEWDILISGRFDGFLRSGAEDAIPPVSGSTPRWGSRSNTPFSASRGPTPGMDRPVSQPYSMASNPASFGGPITIDEEMEIAALAEVEREIYLGMEALEDAFEALHCKAETVRRTLRERGAGLSVANQNRRGSYVEARMGTPSAVGNGFDSGPEDEFLDDGISLAPDDSASNISSNRRRRPKRRTERRTPAPVEEEDEGEEEPHISRRDRERGSRRR